MSEEVSSSEDEIINVKILSFLQFKLKTRNFCSKIEKISNKRKKNSFEKLKKFSNNKKNSLHEVYVAKQKKIGELHKENEELKAKLNSKMENIKKLERDTKKIENEQIETQIKLKKFTSSKTEYGLGERPSQKSIEIFETEKQVLFYFKKDKKINKRKSYFKRNNFK